MKIQYFHVDAFSNEIFKGNPAGVCPLDFWLEDEIMQKIAMENNLSETAFFVNHGDFYKLRWFTPQTEVDLCGHATLASAYVIMKFINQSSDEVVFGTKSGELRVNMKDECYIMNFPSYVPEKCQPPENLVKAFDIIPSDFLAANYYMVIFETEADIKQLKPSMSLIKELDRIGVIVTAPGETVDFVSRFFAPAVGIPEDPVTGSAHCSLAPYWAQKLNKKKLRAFQLSQRGGEVYCELIKNRVNIGGKAIIFFEGTIEI